VGRSGIITCVVEAAEHRRPGRPRSRPATDGGGSAREEILDAAASLFVSQGLAATTTRQIADRVGMRQASLYYYFGGKDDILLELLTQSVRPSLAVARFLESACGPDPAAGLYALAVTDARTLARAPHNIAVLYLSPEVQGTVFSGFRSERSALQDAYGRLGHAACVVPGMDQPLIGTLIMQLVEAVIQLRRTGSLRDDYAHAIAGASLRLVGLPSEEAARAHTAADALLTAAASEAAN